MAELTVLFDFKSPQSYLALAPTLAMLSSAGAAADWQPLLTAPLARPVEPAADAERGVLHRWHRARYRIMDLRRYAEGQGLPESCFADEILFSGAEGRIAAAAWWQHREHPRALELLTFLFHQTWQHGLAVDDVGQVRDAVAALLGDDGGFAAAPDAALAALDTQQEALAAAGLFDAPGYVIGEEVYYGRQHLPMVRWHLGGAAEPAPAWGRAAP